MLDELTHTYSVAELGQRVFDALETCFPDDVWVHGVIVNLKRSRNGHVYFDLCDLVEAGQPPLATLPVALFKMNKDVVNALLKRTGNIRMEDGVQVRVRGVVTFYAPTGRLQLRMTSIDPSFTLGSMAADRDRVLKKLAAEGLIECNRSIPLSAAPLRVGLVTAAGSAAYHDFMTELTNSNISWQVQHIDVQVQGVRAEAAICAALATFAQRSVDVIAMVRGGGSRTDLMAFDSELVARAIAASPAPVFTGIGHETDRAIADEVAHACYKTPTACAQALVALAQGYVRACETAWANVHHRAQAILDDHERATIELATSTASATTRLLTAHRQQSRHLAERIAAETNHALSRAQTRLDRHRATTVGTGRRQLRQAQSGLDQRGTALPLRAARAMARAERAVDITASRVRAHDPARLLARGFTVTRRADGSIVRSTAGLAPDDELLTTFADGTARVRVLAVDQLASRDAADPADERVTGED
ncbi:MAG: exodeoxyribonuclease VII large subunit [Acidimicrobiales bacterium]